MNNQTYIDVIIVGGGLAGLVSAIHLSKSGIDVLVIEKNAYPRHKVCGEYLSNEVLPYLTSLDVNPLEFGAKKINRFMLSTQRDDVLESKLPLGGFGISRFTLDSILAQKAQECGASILQDTVTDIQFLDDEFKVTTKKNQNYISKIVIGAHGKRSNIDATMHRNFMKSRSPFLAVKTHLKGHFPDDLVALHNFRGGYCGVSKVENDHINVCYIVDFKSFRKFGNIQEFQQKVLYKNKHLKVIFKNSEPLFPKPMTISQISFLSKSPVEQHILMCGDSAGMIHPLTGNGMSMAIRSANITSNLIIDYFNGNFKSRKILEKTYIGKWNKEFKTRLKAGRIAASLFRMNYLSEFILSGIKMFPGLLPKIIQQTHGKSMKVK